MISISNPLTQPEEVSPLPQYEDVDLAIIAESTYPYLRGGVSAVIHDIVEANPDRSIGIIHIAWSSDCPTNHAYRVPSNVRWIYPVFLSMDDHLEDFKLASASTLGLSPLERRELSQELFAALHEMAKGNVDPIWQLYEKTLNPRTRGCPLWQLLGTQEFMTCALEAFAEFRIPFTKLFWLLREFFSLACAIAGEDYPRASVYHSHTTGYAGLLAAVAARQNGGRVFLTEHNLYTRDTINSLLSRNMNTVVSAKDWRTDTEVDPRQRAWMAWYTEIGRLIYRAADHITYLYPAAVAEARGLGSEPAKSEIVPNGMLLDKFESARARYLSRREAIRQAGGQATWRLAYCARLVPIKGLIDLITTVSQLVQAGVRNFTLDVMGHADEVPDYADECYQLAHELGLDDYVHFRGNLNIAEVLGDFDALILPSYNEGQPLVVMEAMAVGLPVIGTHVGGMEQLILSSLGNNDQPGPGPCGILVRPGKVAELADAIYRLTTDQALYSSFAHNSRERISRYFTLRKAMGSYRLIYRELEMAAVCSIPAPRPMHHPAQPQPVGRHRQEDLEWQEWVAKSLSPLRRAGESDWALPRR
jgi:polysaccharide biosynthesis protein PelF